MMILPLLLKNLYMPVSEDVQTLVASLEKLNLLDTKTHAKKMVSILRMEKGSNKFVVTEDQYQLTKELLGNRFANFSEWYLFFSQKGVKNLPLLFSAFKINHKAIFKDQLARSKFIVDYVSQHKDMEVISMDGHGRLIYTMINYALQNDVQFKTNLVDIDQTTNDFHKEMFPEKVFGDNPLSVRIPKPQDILDMDSDFLDSVKNPFLYLNFCGISCCSTSKMSGRNRVRMFIEKWLRTHKCIMISLSLRPHGFVERVDGKLTNYGMIQQFNNVEVSRRTNFLTYFITN